MWKLAPGSSWSKLGVLQEAVTDLGVDANSRLWACAAAIYKLEGAVFTKLDIGTSSVPRRFLLEGASPGWFATYSLVYKRRPDGTYAGVGPGANALAFSANGRFFMAADLGWILSGHAP